MNQLQKIVLFSSACVLSATHVFAADPIIIGGFKYTVDKSEFDVNGGTHKILLDVHGDSGQEMIFDIEAQVRGRGIQEVTKMRTCSVPEGAPMDQCWMVKTQEIASPEFKFDIELKAYCSGIPITMDRQNKNELTDTFIEYNWRTLNLVADKTMSTGGNCKQMQVDIIPKDALSIDDIELDITISNAF